MEAFSLDRLRKLSMEEIAQRYNVQTDQPIRGGDLISRILFELSRFGWQTLTLGAW